MMNEEAELDEGSLEEMKRRTLDVMKGPRDTNSRSWVEVVMKMKEFTKEWDALPSLAWINHLIFKLKMNKEKKEKEDKERMEKEEREKEEEEEKQKKEKEERENLKRQWDGLPSPALLNIFCNTELKDRLQSIPLVCKSWKTVTDDPRCWYSMIPDSVSPEDAFIKKRSGYSFPYYFLPQEEENFLVGISRLLTLIKKSVQTLIKKSGGGAAITTLYLNPFTPYSYRYPNQAYDEILHLIANCCPNLKHISFDVQPHTSSMEAVLLLLNKCKKLELIELFHDRGGGFGDQKPTYSNLLESLSCLPNLYGLHIYRHDYFLAVCTTIATHLPRLKLLRLDCGPLEHKHLSVMLFSCLELKYLYVTVDRKLYYNQDILDQAFVQIPEFYYQRDTCDSPSDHDNYSVLDEYSHNVFEDHVSKKIDHASRIVGHDFRINDDFRIDDYRDILKQRKEDQYVSILKEKMNNKKKNYQCNSSLIKKKKKKNSTLKKNKKDQCVYVDYVIQSK